MPDVTESATEVGQMLVQALQNTFGMGPDAALAQAQADTGVTDAQIANVDMGQALDYACQQPGLSPEAQSYLQNASANYNSYGNVSQSGGYASGGNQSGYSGGSGGSGGYSGGSGGSGGAATNAQIVQQVTSNYNYQEINDNHIDILGNVDGDIDIDQDNDDIHDIGDGNAINTGSGDQNAATGDHASAANSESGNAVSNTGDGAVVGGDDVDLDHSAVGDNNTIIDAEDGGNVNTGSGDLINNEDGNVATDGSSILDNRDGSIDDHSADHGGVSLDNSDGGSIDDSSLGFGSGNVQGDVTNEEGAANSQGGNANGTSVNVNVGSQTNTEHGPGDLNDNDDFGKGHHAPVLHPTEIQDAPHLTADHEAPQHEEIQHDVPVHAEVEPEPQHEEIQHDDVQHVAEAETHDDGGHEGADHMLDDHAIG
jgi:hypothetical protein